MWGLIGALRMGVIGIEARFRPSDSNVSEKALLEYILSHSFTNLMTRCFSDGHKKPTSDSLRLFLRKCIVMPSIMGMPNENEEDGNFILHLQKTGILTPSVNGHISFTSPVARRFYADFLFTHRADVNPKSVCQLLQNAIQSLSPESLRKAAVTRNFPKEAVFQHMMWEALTLCTTAESSICAELSAKFPASGEENSPFEYITGALDFYVDGDLRWGIELLVNGNDIKEHMERFQEPNGKYVPLQLNDYAIVDFRVNSSGEPTAIVRHEKRISVFFKENDYSQAKCIFGMDQSPITIFLGVAVSELN